MDKNLNAQKTDEAATESATQTQSALNEDVGTAVQQTQVDFCLDQEELEVSSPSQRVAQDRYSQQEQETVGPADDVGNSTATGEALI